ncbi:MAG: RraA family protein [Bryobacterales bacterium]|nr:RraA family protein [Bryobacterales bacterium]
MITAEQRAQILRYDTCKIANAIESLKIRLRNEGFTRPGFRCVTHPFPAVLGYAVTSTVRCADPPMKGYTEYHLADWWENLVQHPGPRIAVIQDVDNPPGQGAVLSDVHAHILRALDCRGVVTNGAVRNVGELARLNFPAFSAHVAMSRAYVHMVEFDVPVTILGLTVRPADLIYVDVHGALLIPEEVISDVIQRAAEIESRERFMIGLCQTPSFSIQTLKEAARAAQEARKENQ